MDAAASPAGRPGPGRCGTKSISGHSGRAQQPTADRARWNHPTPSDVQIRGCLGYRSGPGGAVRGRGTRVGTGRRHPRGGRSGRHRYWHRKREQWRMLAERAPDSATADYLHEVFDPPPARSPAWNGRWKPSVSWTRPRRSTSAAPRTTSAASGPPLSEQRTSPSHRRSKTVMPYDIRCRRPNGRDRRSPPPDPRRTEPARGGHHSASPRTQTAQCPSHRRASGSVRHLLLREHGRTSPGPSSRRRRPTTA